MTEFDAIEVGRRVLSVEAEALKTMADALDETFAKAVEILFAAKGRIVCTGVGKSGHVGRKIASTLASTGTPAMWVHATEASHGDLGMVGADDVVLAISKTGETRELADIITYARRFSIPLIAMTAVPRSALGRSADVVLTIPNSNEAADKLNAPTTSTTLQMALGDALAVALLERRGFTPTSSACCIPAASWAPCSGRWAISCMARATCRSWVRRRPCARLSWSSAPNGSAASASATLRAGSWGSSPTATFGGRSTACSITAPGEVMTHGPKTVPRGMLAAEALKHMTDTPPPTTVLFVVENEKPVGILHVHDLLRAGVM